MPDIEEFEILGDLDDESQDVVPPDDAEWEEFRSFHSSLKNVIADHFGNSETMDHERMADFIWKRRLSCLQNFWSKNEVIDDLSKLKRSLIDIDRILKRLPEAISGEIKRAALQSVLGKNTDELGLKENQSVQDYVDELPSWKAYFALTSSDEHISQTLLLIDAALDFATSGLPVGNKGLDAWRTVDVCAELCSLFPGTINVPSRMNNSGPFYKFLADVFDAIGHTEDPISAFRGWRGHVVRTAEKNS